MNYGKKGSKKRQAELTSKGIMYGKKMRVIFCKVLLVCCFAVAIIGGSLGFGVYKGILDSAPSIDDIDATPTGYLTTVLDNQGNEIATLVASGSNRKNVTIDEIPINLQHAFVALEDSRFYEHNGIDLTGIIRAGVTGIASGGNFSQGASTITQQLLKNTVFTEWTSETSFIDKLERKIQEQYLAVQLEKKVSKNWIMENYLNTINLGQNTLGVQAASRRYFGKDVSELNLSECAVIAGITQNPSKYNPISHPDENAKRREKVLNNMKDQGYITQAEYDEAIADDVYSRIQIVNDEVDETLVNTYFVDALTDDVMNDLLAAGYNETQAFTLLYSGGLKIYSTQDPNIQSICDEVFSNEENYPENTRWQLSYALTIKRSNGDFENFSTEKLQAFYKEQNASYNLIYDSQEAANEDIEYYKQFVLGTDGEVYDEKITLTPQPQVSITIEDQHTGCIVAMVGGRGAKEGSKTLNRATDTTRQPGSTFKIVAVYAPALDSAGLTLATMVNDAPFNYANGRPVSNWWGSEYRGLNSIRQAIIDSMNVIAVKTFTAITPQLGYDYLKNFGFTTVVDREEITYGGNTYVYSDIQQSTALGGLTHGVTNEELNAAYACIANGGTYIKPKLYTKVVDHDGNVILDNTEPETKQVIKETTAWLLTDAMQDVVTQGTGASVNFGGMAIAGKTGTTSDYNDVWFSGYTPYYTATTWTGYDNNTKLRKGEERNLAKKLWRATMAKIHEELPSQSFTMPSGIVQATVCARSGKLPIAGLCDGTLKTEYFAEGNVPTESCNVHYQGPICQYTNLPASEQCPFKVEGVLEVTPADDPLMSGDSTLPEQQEPQTQEIVNEDGSITTVTIPGTAGTCPHNAEFFANPDAEAIIAQQRNEIIAAQQNAALAAQAEAAANAAEGGGEQPPAEQPAG